MGARTGLPADSEPVVERRKGQSCLGLAWRFLLSDRKNAGGEAENIVELSP